MMQSLDRKVRFFFCLLGLLELSFTCSSLGGQTALMLTGTVQDSTGAVIPAAQISLESSDGVTIAHGVTNSTGIFRLAVANSAQYVLDVVEPGFRELRQSITVKAGAQPALRILLAVEAKDETVTVGSDGSSSLVSIDIGRAHV